MKIDRIYKIHRIIQIFYSRFPEETGNKQSASQKKSIHLQFKLDYRPKYKLGSHSAIPGNSMTMIRPTIITSTKGMIER